MWRFYQRILKARIPFRALDVNVEDLQNTGIHMNVVESEKLKWMEDVPKVPHPLPKAFNARFDFDGKPVVAADIGL